MFLTPLKTVDGLALHTLVTEPIEQPVAKVILIHGFGDHSEALPYRNLTRHLVAHNFAVYSFDLRGHGQSEGQRMFVQNWDEIGTDVGSFVDCVRQEAPALPLFLVGLSMGGLIALNYVIKNPAGIRGIVAAAPAVGTPGIPPIIKRLMPVFSRLMPMASINPGLDLSRISRDSAAAQEYTTDPHFQTKTTPRLAAEVLTAIDQTRNLAPQIKLPLLILHGAEDTIAPPDGSAEFFSQISSTDKERITYPGAYHNLFIETNREQVFSDIVHWLEKHF